MNTYEATEQAYKNGYEQGKKDALAKDNNVPSKWIPVGERLPEPFVDVIAFFGGQEMNVDCVDNKGRWYSSYMDRDDPTHWMPLPEPPKGE